MTDEEIKEPDRFGIPENKNPLIIGIVVALLAIAVIAIVFLQLPADSATLKPAVIHNNTSQLTTVSYSDTPEITKTTRPTEAQTVQQTQATPSVPVDFILLSGSPSICGLTCRQLDASITNAGYATAHNVCIEVSMHNSRNEIINLNGVAILQQCVGDIAGGQSKTEPITINADCGAFATKCIGETLTLKTRVTSGEKSVQFPDQLIAV